MQPGFTRQPMSTVITPWFSMLENLQLRAVVLILSVFCSTTVFFITASVSLPKA